MNRHVHFFPSLGVRAYDALSCLVEKGFGMATPAPRARVSAVLESMGIPGHE